ncbi:hypothetical protein Syun_015438 [Stephania yunnanensis]|uniref:Bet v I/Major latex protein domain-containing protein n=1 Tax=Stephania yunnanensis TaxID=152371 RepID=A0AAP0JL62_9MAGN
MIKKELRHYLEVPVPADRIWAVYSSPDLAKHLLEQLLPGVFEKVKILEGDGGVGTVLLIKFPPGTVPRSYEEKFVTIDNEKRLKEVVMVKGGYLDMGCTFYMDTIHVIAKGPDSCIVASKVNYEVPNEEIEQKVAPFISTEALEAMANVITNYVINMAKKKVLLEQEVAANVSAKKQCEFNGSSDLSKFLLELLPRVFRDVEIVERKGGLGTDIRISIPPGLVVPVTISDKGYGWCNRTNLKNRFLCLMSFASLMLMVYLSSKFIADMF